MSHMEVSARPAAPFPNDPAYGSHRNIAILPSSAANSQPSPPDVMDVSPPSPSNMPPPKTTSPETDQGDVSPTNSNGNPKWSASQSKKDGDKSSGDSQAASNGSNGQNNVNAAVAAQTQQPKVVQTAFIHKLYNMLEDQNISHLISWSSSGESFVMAPTHEFSKVLSQYFKHTNISSFVRQLNMYGFHKVSDVFHTAGSETMWEFKHGNGSFKKGDTASLRDIRRRASRHSLISRETFHQPAPKHTVPQPGVPAEPANTDPDHRLASLEFSFNDMHNRMLRVDDANRELSNRCEWLMDNLAKQQQWNATLCQTIMKMIPDRESPLYRDLTGLHRDISSARFDSHDAHRHHYPPMSTAEPVSPRQAPIDDRRSSLSSSLNHSPYRPSFPRPPLPQQPAISPRRYGSASGAATGYQSSNSAYSPTTPTTAGSRPPLSGPQYTLPGLPASHAPHPLSSVAEPGQPSNPGNLARRHTSADIRANEGWQAAQHQQGTATPVPPLPPPSGAASGHWPSSPIPPHQQHPPHDASAQELRNTLNSFDFGSASRRGTVHSRPSSPPAPDREMAPIPPIGGPFAGHGENGAGSWNFPPANGDRPKPSYSQRFADAQSAPPTRRGSLVNNLHSLLNPADTAERMEEEEAENEKRKRKRAA